MLFSRGFIFPGKQIRQRGKLLANNLIRTSAVMSCRQSTSFGHPVTSMILTSGVRFAMYTPYTPDPPLPLGMRPGFLL